jgi:multimeric flavodoxin WrbA
MRRTIMKVLGISGSPRDKSNSEILLSHALEPFKEKGWEITIFQLNDKTVQPCKGCDCCISTGSCIQQDDMQELYGEYMKWDALIIASPAYFRNVTAQLKAVFDRSYAIRSKNPLSGKLGGAIAVGKGQDGGQSIVLAIIYNFFLSSGVLCVPGELNGVTAVADKPGDILTQPNRLRQARILGENILKYSKI